TRATSSRSACGVHSAVCTGASAHPRSPRRCGRRVFSMWWSRKRWVASACWRPPRRPEACMTLRVCLVHLRLHFQLLLAPVFLWGWLVAGGRLSGSVALAFVAFHIFLYGGATAYNSYYDRDVGPVGGLEHPPPVPESLLPFAIGAKLIGWAIAWL